MPSLDSTFTAVSDPIRRAILDRLGAGSATVSELAAPFRVSLPAISKHLRMLERAGLIRREREGRVHWISLEPKPFADAERWLAQYRRFWDGSLDRLEAFLGTEALQEADSADRQNDFQPDPTTETKP